ncbi:MAG: hypothetical protein RBT63_00800, partial [Bdellovibrionales bacterium]|nr:hypothetical protein [Bdellovibrionales bacterium]
MNTQTQLDDPQKKRKLIAVLTVSAVMIFLAMDFFTLRIVTGFLFSKPVAQTEDPLNVVAVIREREQDVRQKPMEEEEWYIAEREADVVLGDAVYSGSQSSAEVQMVAGGTIVLGEETLVVFDSFDGVTVPDVARGQVRLQLNGQMRVAISGEMTEFMGSQSELLVDVADGAASKVQVVAGSVEVSVGSKLGSKGQPGATGQRQTLSVGEETLIPKSEVSPQRAARIQSALMPPVGKAISSEKLSARRAGRAKTMAPAPLAEKAAELPPVNVPVEPTLDPVPPVAEAMVEANNDVVPEIHPETLEQETVVQEALPEAPEAFEVAQKEVYQARILKLEEAYQKVKGNTYTPRSGVRTIEEPIRLAWTGVKPEEKVRVQISRSPSFENSWYNELVSGSEVVVGKWRAGKNHWRVARIQEGAEDATQWSDAGVVTVDPMVDRAVSPVVTVPQGRIPLVRSSGKKGAVSVAKARLRFDLAGGQKNAAGWLVQGATDQTFSKKSRYV